MEYWNTGILEYWNIGILEYWNTGTYVSERYKIVRGSPQFCVEGV